jgi:long-chain acyl-CoA synthetase
LLERYHAMGLLVLEAYGMSENVIPIAANRLNAYRFGTVGRPMRGCEVRLAEDGELMVRGPGVAVAYYGEEQTELRDRDGYLASGDFASIDPDGFITLTGRKSEILKTATGRRIAPAGIEALLLQAKTLEHAMVVGASRPFLTAVVDVSPDGLERGMVNDARQPDLRAYCERLRLELAPLLELLPASNRPSGLLVTTRPFTVEGGELTANLKLRRQNIAARYAAEFDTLYRRLGEARGGHVLESVPGKEQDMMLCSL